MEELRSVFHQAENGTAKEPGVVGLLHRKESAPPLERVHWPISDGRFWGLPLNANHLGIVFNYHKEEVGPIWSLCFRYPQLSS